jgi:hypothetical protein
MGKIEYKQEIVGCAVPSFRLFVGVYEAGDLSECKKAYTERQYNVLQMDLETGYMIDIRNDKIRILEVSQKADIGCNAKDQQPFPAGLIIGVMNRVKSVIQEEVKKDTAKDQRNVSRFPPSIEKKRYEHEPDLTGRSKPVMIQNEIQDKGYWKKQVNVFV